MIGQIPLKFKEVCQEKIILFLRTYDSLKGLPFWIAAVTTGLMSVLYARLFRYAEHRFLDLHNYNPYYVFIATPLGFLVAWWLVYKFAPNAKGSGIPQVLASIELSQESCAQKRIIRHLVSLPITAIKILSSFITVICGGAVGREGPTIQISAYIFHSIGVRFNKIWDKQAQEVFFISGGAAGIAAAFNTPLGGVVYAIEELSKTSFHRFRTSLFAAVIIAGVTAQLLSGPYLFIGIPRISTDSGAVIPLSFLIGIITGLAGAFFGKLLYFVSQIREKIKSPVGLAALAVGLGLVVAALIVFVNPSSANSGKDLISEYMFNDQPSSLSLVGVRFAAPILTYFSGSAGGVFSPALSAGASIGAFVADLFSSPYRNTFIMLGMIGFLSGFTGAPFTAFVLVLEMTDRHSIILPMMLTALTAFMVSQLISKVPFYEKMKELFVAEERHILDVEKEKATPAANT